MARRLTAVLTGIWMAGAACAPGQDGGFFLEKPVAEQPSPEVALSAVAAVRLLGAEVVKGNFRIAYDRMYPQWKERTARQFGGMDRLEAKMVAASQELTRQGVSIVSFQPAGEPKVFEVWPGKKLRNEGGQAKEIFVYTKWLVIIPTATRFNIIQNHQNQVIESRGYQVAISDKGTNDWTFIDGASLTVPELRSLFLTLPEDFKLPEIERRVVPPEERR
jgi:hypothetical protein